MDPVSSPWQVTSRWVSLKRIAGGAVVVKLLTDPCVAAEPSLTTAYHS